MGLKEQRGLRTGFNLLGGLLVLIGAVALAAKSWPLAIVTLAVGMGLIALGFSTKGTGAAARPISPDAQERLLRMQPTGEDMERLGGDATERDDHGIHP